MRVLFEVINNLSYKDVICQDTPFIKLEGKARIMVKRQCSRVIGRQRNLDTVTIMRVSFSRVISFVG